MTSEGGQAAPTPRGQRPVADGLFTWPAAQPELLGSCCLDCAAHTFPAQDSCPRCGSLATEVVPLGSEGTLWTWTTQEFRPKTPPYTTQEAPEAFQRYYVGYVELPGLLRVEARLTDVGDDGVAIGDPMTLRIVPFVLDEDGTEVMTYAFAPVRSERAS